MAALLVVVGYTAWSREIVIPATPPTEPAPIRDTATVKLWTINDVPVADGAVFVAGEELEVAGDLVLKSLAKLGPNDRPLPLERTPWGEPVERWIIFIRFAQAAPRDRYEMSSGIAHLFKRLPRKKGEIYRSKVCAPTRPGEYELQLAVCKHRHGDFSPNLTVEGDVVAAARVRVRLPDKR